MGLAKRLLDFENTQLQKVLPFKCLAGVFRVLPVPHMIKLLNFHFSAFNSVA